VPHLRRRTERNGIDIGRTFKQIVQGRKMFDTLNAAIGAGGSGEFNPHSFSNRGNVLIPGNLAKTNDGNADGSHGRLSGS
jgi:hypothetical protein